MEPTKDSDKISDIHRLKELRQQLDQMSSAAQAWPFFKPFAKAIGVNTDKIDHILSQVPELRQQIYDMSDHFDKFNSLFSDIGWIVFDSIELDTVKEAIRIAEEGNIDQADEFLADHFSPEWIEKRLYMLKMAKGFGSRFNLAQLALEDYKTGRYYASTLVTLTLIDGWVNELNLVGFNRYGFFAEQSELIAWDSIAAHPRGLVKLREVLSQSRFKTRTEQIKIPYRNGIMHGADLGYNNKFVAAKCWAALFAVRDWAIRAANNQLKPPEPKVIPEKSFQEVMQELVELQREKEALKSWQPRSHAAGETFLVEGNLEDYEEGTPERLLVQFLVHWKQRNYGFMSQCFSPMMPMKPVDIKHVFQDKGLQKYELCEISDIAPAICEITVKVTLDELEQPMIRDYRFRLLLADAEGKSVLTNRDNSQWGIVNWRTL